jgi:hypothetical protein
MTEKKQDFFISYNGSDKDWAEWIGWELEDVGYSVVIQAWDFRPGGNFVLEMQKAAQAERTLVVLSPNYLAAQFTQPEWAAAFAQDPTGEKGILLPVRVAECNLQGLLPAIIYIDLVDLEEATARETLLAGVKRGRAKPSVPPGFPAGRGHVKRQPPRFPSPPLLFNKIKDQIRSLLNQAHAHCLCNEIIQRSGKESAIDALVPQPSEFSVEILDLMHHATKDCLDKLAEQKPDMVDSVKRIAQEIFGWLVLLAVDVDQVRCSGCGFNPWQAGTEATIPLESEAGTEVLISSLGERYACFILRYDRKNRVRAVGRDSFMADDLEDGLHPDDRLKGILQRIWVATKIEGEAPNDLEQLKRKLKPKLEGRERRKEGHYYITIPSDRQHSPLADKQLLKSIIDAVPPLRVIYLGSGQSEGILLMEEDSLWESIEAFLLMLRDTP